MYSVAILDIVQFFAFKINRNLMATTPILLFYKYGQAKWTKKYITEKEILFDSFFDKNISFLDKLKIPKTSTGHK